MHETCILYYRRQTQTPSHNLLIAESLQEEKCTRLLQPETYGDCFLGIVFVDNFEKKKWNNYRYPLFTVFVLSENQAERKTSGNSIYIFLSISCNCICEINGVGFLTYSIDFSFSLQILQLCTTDCFLIWKKKGSGSEILSYWSYDFYFQSSELAPIQSWYMKGCEKLDKLRD